MKYWNGFLLCCVFLWGCATVSTKNLSTDSNRAAKSYKDGNIAIDNRSFQKGIQHYKEAVDKDPAFADAYQKLAGAYSTLGKTDSARKYLEKLKEIKPSDPDFAGAYLKLGNLNFESGEYEKAVDNFKTFVRFSDNTKKNDEVKAKIKTCEFGIEAKKHPVTEKPEKLKKPLNQFNFQDYPVLTADQKTMFFSIRKGMGARHDENIAMSNKRNGKWQKPAPLSVINSRKNDAGCSVSSDGRVMVFSSCNRKDSRGGCDLYISYKEDGAWQEPENMGDTINTRNWEANPALTSDGRALYFASNRTGGYGKKDIWYVEKDGDGNWKEPVNAGKTINTNQQEAAPFLHANDQTLFFVSKGYPGMGGYDIYYSKKTGDTTWSAPENMGYPINTHKNDSRVYITPDGKTGYYSRYTQKGFKESYSNLYRFTLPDSLTVNPVCTYAEGTVTDAESGEKLSARVELYDIEEQKKVREVRSDGKTGKYTIVLAQGNEYALYANKEGYLFYSDYFNFKDTASFDPVVLDIAMQPVHKGSKVRLANVFFETNKYALKPKSKSELNKVITFLKANKGIQKIEISGHTDNVGTVSDNMELSRNRARAVYNYLKENGVQESRMVYKGYGESQPVAGNDTPEGRQQNRRIEFRILEEE